MKKISSFTVNHDILTKGMYISRIDGDIVTYDIRMKNPNKEDYLSYGAIHTFEHLFATYVRNSQLSDSIIYVGPMGCRTGFYFLTRNSITHEQALELIKSTLKFVVNFEGDIPGNKRQECGNYLEHDRKGAKEIAKDMVTVLSDWTREKMDYKGEYKNEQI